MVVCVAVAGGVVAGSGPRLCSAVVAGWLAKGEQSKGVIQAEK